MSFKVNSRFIEAGNIASCIEIGKFELFLSHIIEKLGLESNEIFTSKEKASLMKRFDLTIENLETLLESCCYAFKQAAFIGMGPDTLYESLLNKAHFSEDHAKLMGKCWANESQPFVASLKKKSLGARELNGVNYHLNITTADDSFLRLLDPTAVFELSLSRDNTSLCSLTNHNDTNDNNSNHNTNIGNTGVETGFLRNPILQPNSSSIGSKKGDTDNDNDNGNSNASVSANISSTGNINGGEKFSFECNHEELYAFFQKLEHIQSQLDTIDPSTSTS